MPWDYQVSSGRKLWDELVYRYTHGVEVVSQMRRTWAGLERFVDPERFAQVAAFLAIQEQEAQWWRDASIAYFQSINGLPLPAGFAPPAHPLEYYKALKFPYAPGRPGANRSRSSARSRFRWNDSWLGVRLLAITAAFAADPAPPRELTAEQDHKLMMEQLGISVDSPGCERARSECAERGQLRRSEGQSVSRAAGGAATRRTASR